MPRRETGEPYYRVNLDEAAEMYDNENSLVIDVRRPDEYMNGHVKNATHIVVDNLYSEIDNLPKDKNLMFICEVGVRSGLACEMAAAMGLDPEKLFNIEDGTGSWIAKGLPSSTGSEKSQDFKILFSKKFSARNLCLFLL